MRTITINDKKLRKILEERAVVYKKIGEINKKIVTLDNERTKESYKMDRLKNKTAPIVEKHTPSFEMGEFEIVSRVFVENGTPQVEIIDLIDEYKESLRKDKKKQ